MAKNKENQSAEVLDAPVQRVKETSNPISNFDVDNFFEKNRKILFISLAVVFVLGLGYAGYNYYISSQDSEAKKEVFPAEYYWEHDSLDLALNGDKVNRGLIEISEEYSGTTTANLANYRIGFAYLKKGKYEEAIEYLKKFNSSDLLVQARAYSLIGDANLELKNYEEAINYYKKASEYKPNEYFSPRYLMKLGLAYELNNDYKSAAEAYGKIETEYSTAQEYNDARKFKARAEELGGQE